MTNKFTRGALIAALFVELGGHLIFVQAFAWGSMTFSRLHRMPLKAALMESLDGRHPCGLCFTAQKDAQSNKARQSRGADAKVDLIMTAAAWIQAPRTTSRFVRANDVAVVDSELRIDVPPPRILQA